MNQNTLTTRQFVRKYWYVFFGVLIFFIILVSYVFRVLTSRIPVQENTWNTITPGFSTQQQVLETLGQPISTRDIQSGSQLLYSSDFPTIPTEVDINDSGKVERISQRLLYDENHKLEIYTQKYGTADLIRPAAESSGSTILHFFAEEGLGVFVNIVDDTVSKIWYLTPMSTDSFLEKYGEQFPEETEAGEPIEQSNLYNEIEE